MGAEELRVRTHPILGPAPQRPRVTFFFNGEPVMGEDGEPIAIALWAAGIKTLGQNVVDGRAHGVYCAIGHCYECRVFVDGRRNVRACLEPVRAGLRVQSQLQDGAEVGNGDA